MTTPSLSATSRRFWLGAALAGVVGALIAGCGRSHHGWHGWHRPGHGLHDVASVDEAREHAHEASRWILRRLDATDEQRARINRIVDESVGQLYPLHEQHDRNRAALLEALSQPQIDRAEVERLRKAEIELADTATNWVGDAVVDAMEVLTPEQRAEVLAHIREKHG